MTIFAITAAMVAAAFGIGVIVGLRQLFPLPQIYRFKRRHWDREDPLRVGIRRPKSSPIQPPGKFTQCILIIGQSNAANEGQERGPRVSGAYDLSLYDNKTRILEDPIANASGTGGSVWTHLAQIMRTEDPSLAPLFCSIAVNRTSIGVWAPRGELHGRIDLALEGMRAVGTWPTHVLLQLGEQDCEGGMDGKVYEVHLRALVDSLRGKNIAAPIFISISTICRSRTPTTIGQAQYTVATTSANCHLGADTDRLDRVVYRFDAVHFSAEGLKACAHLWYNALRPHLVPS
jgi:hypothetical protein